MAKADAQTEQDIIRLEEQWIEAIARRDAAALDHLLADDFLIAGWLPDGQVGDKSLYLTDCLTPIEVSDASHRFEQWRIKVYDDILIVHCVFESQAMVGGQLWGGRFLLTDVWRQEENRWRVVARHCSPVVAGKEQ